MPPHNHNEKVQYLPFAISEETRDDLLATFVGSYFRDIVRIEGVEIQAPISAATKAEKIKKMQQIWNETAVEMFPVFKHLIHQGKNYFPLETWLDNYSDTFKTSGLSGSSSTIGIMNRASMIQELLRSASAHFPNDDIIQAEARMEAIMIGLHDLIDNASFEGGSEYIEHFDGSIRRFIAQMRETQNKTNIILEQAQVV